jgi:hypothetical protein
MRRLSPELLIFLLLFLAIPLLNLLAQWARRRLERQRPAAWEAPDQLAPPRPEEPPRRIPRPVLPPGARVEGLREIEPSRPARVAVRPAVEVPLPARSPRGRRPPLGGPVALRRAVVLAAILGPCRALQGPGPLDTP